MLKKAQFYFLVGILYTFSILPFWFLYWISDFLAFFLYKVIAYRLSTIRENLFYSFPEKNREELEVIVKKYYAHLADLLVEALKMFTMDVKSVQKHYKAPVNMDHLDPETQKGLDCILNSQGCIGMLGHYGNWEWAIFSSTFSFPTLETWVIYKPLSDKNFDQLFNKIRSRFGAHLVDMKKILRKFAETPKHPYFAFFVSDQTPLNLPTYHKITFLNQETLVYLGAEKIAHSKNIPVVYVEIQKVNRGVYETHLEILAEEPSKLSPEEINLRFQRRLEKTIQEKPEFWLWSHKRWKYTRNK